jgi:hypothetical protein
VIEGCDPARLEEYCKASILEAVVREGGALRAEILFIGLLIIGGMSKIEYNMVCREAGWDRDTLDVGMM